MSTPITVPSEVVVWNFGGKPGNLRSQNEYATNTGYTLFCQTNGRYLTYAKQTFGINIDYAATGNDHKWHLRLPDGAEREVLSGESVALALGGSPSFLRYGKRPLGINLEYADNPAYQWRIFGSGAAIGSPIPTGSLVAILNERVEPTPDFLIHFGRTGADIGWTTSPSDFDLFTGAAKDLVGAAKQVFG